MGAVSYLTYLRPFLETWERFSSSPYWDVTRWSWGYGTEVPGSVRSRSVVPAGTITRDAAFKALQAHAANDYAYLAPLVVGPLNPRQWAAYLSFSYNVGPGNADNLLPNLNARDLDALGEQWSRYVYDSNGNYSSNLAARRAAEWDLFTS